MNILHPQAADSFYIEMEKMAGLAGSAATLGTLGGLIGAGTGYAKAKQEGEGTGGVLLGAAKSGLLGGAIGAGAGAGAAGLSKALRGSGEAVVEGAAKMPWYKTMDRSLSDFGQRQVHALTGYVPKGQDREAYLHGIGVGGRGAAGAALDAAKAEQKALGSPTGGTWDAIKRWRAKRAVEGEEAALKAHNTLMGAQATSLPGFVRALVKPGPGKPGRGDVLKASVNQAWHGGGAIGKGMMGLGAVGAAQGAFGAAQPGEENMGRGERVGRGLGQMAGSILPWSIPIAGQLVGGEFMSSGLGRLGKVFDRPRIVPPPPRMTHDPTDPVASTAHQTGPQVAMSPSAQGKSFGAGMEGAPT